MITNTKYKPQQAADRAAGALSAAYVSATDAEAMASAAYHGAMAVGAPYRSEVLIEMARVAFAASAAYVRAITAVYNATQFAQPIEAQP